MIPFAMKDALRRLRAIEEDDDEQPGMSHQGGEHDVVVRYATVVIALVLVIACLSIAKQMAMPITAGVIFGLVLGPLVDRLIRLGIPHGLAAAVVVLIGILVIVLVIGLFAAPFAIWSDQLPGIIAALKNRFSNMLAMIKQFEGVASTVTPDSAARTVVVEGDSAWMTVAISSTTAAGGLLIFLATVYFYLATRRHLKARALRLCLGGSARRTAGQLLIDIEEKLAAYFGIVTLINLGMGVATTLIAWLAGLPFPIFWGLLAFILNYIAFVGPIIVTALLFGAVLIVSGDGWLSAWPALAYFIVHLIEGNVVTPLLVGRRLTLSPFLVFMSFVFWLWLWGPVGAILSVPILLLMTLSFQAASAYRNQDVQMPDENQMDSGGRTIASSRDAPALQEHHPAMAAATLP
jgi:predicted PurR-regulated permease PerM